MVRRKSELNSHMVEHLCIYKAVQLKSRLENTGNWLAAARPPRRLCYRPVIIFRYLLHCAFTAARKNSGVKGKVLPRTGHEGPEREQRCTSTLSLTLALDEGGWSTPRPGRFTPWKETRYPLYRRLGGPQGRSGRVLKISPPPGFDPRTVQPVAQSQYRLRYPGPQNSGVRLRNVVFAIYFYFIKTAWSLVVSVYMYTIHQH